jgi:heptosyltransferase III
MKKNILINFRGALGDTICLAGCLEDFRALHPEANISVFCLYPDVLEGNPNIDSILREPVWTRTPFTRSLKKKVPFLGSITKFVKRLVEKSRAVQKEVFEITWEFMFQNRALHLQDTIRLQLGLPAECKRQNPQLFLTKAETNNTFKKFRMDPDVSYLVFSTDAGWLSRQWPEPFWCDLVHRLESDGYSLVRLGRGTDRTASQSVDGGYLDLENKTSIRESAAVIKSAQLLVSVDSGLFHLAAAVNTEAVGLFGPVDPELRIYSERSHGLVTTNTHCVACSTTQDLQGVDGHCPSGTFECMLTLDVDAVYAECKKYIELS